MSVKLLTEHHLKFLSLKGGCTGSSESTLVKTLHCWKPHVVAHMLSMLLGVQLEKHWHWGRGGGLKCILMVLNLRPRFLDKGCHE